MWQYRNDACSNGHSKSKRCHYALMAIIVRICHKLPHLVGNVGCKLQKNQNNKIVSSGWVVDIKKWFERWYVEGLFELSSDVMNYVVIGERLAEPLEGIIGKMLKRQN